MEFTGFRHKYLSSLLVRNHRRLFRPKFWMVSRKKCSSRAEERIAKNWNDLTRAIIDYNPFWDGTFAVYVFAVYEATVWIKLFQCFIEENRFHQCRPILLKKAFSQQVDFDAIYTNINLYCIHCTLVQIGANRI